MNARRWLAVAMSGTGMLGWASGCTDEETAGPDEGAAVEELAIEEEEFGVYEGDEIEDLADHRFVGRTVVVSAQVDDIVEAGGAFLIGADIVDGGLLVLMPQQLTDIPPLEEGLAVQVVARVIHFTAGDIPPGLGGLELDDDAYRQREAENALVAQAVTPAPTEDPAR